MRNYFILLIFILGLSIQSIAQGDLLVTPKRVVFDGNKRTERLNLVNIGQDTNSYTISFLQKKMTEDGSFINIMEPEAGQFFADPYLRVFPRVVVLAPGEPQTVTLQFRRGADMQEAEYRSHLYFRSEANYQPLGMEGREADSSALLNVQLIPVFGISIPVIIRNGNLNVSTTISDIALMNIPGADQNLKLTLNRTGTSSVYGNVKIDFIPSRGKAYEVGIVKGISVYTNLSKRNILVRLTNTKEVPLENGKLRVQYISNDDNKTVVYALGEIDL